MKVGQLVYELSQFDDDVEVFLEDWAEGYSNHTSNFCVMISNRFYNAETQKFENKDCILLGK